MTDTYFPSLGTHRKVLLGYTGVRMRRWLDLPALELGAELGPVAPCSGFSSVHYGTSGMSFSRPQLIRSFLCHLLVRHLSSLSLNFLISKMLYFLTILRKGPSSQSCSNNVMSIHWFLRLVLLSFLTFDWLNSFFFEVRGEPCLIFQKQSPP